MAYCDKHKRVPDYGRTIYSCMIFSLRTRYIAPLGLFRCPKGHFFVADGGNLDFFDWMGLVEE